MGIFFCHEREKEGERAMRRKKKRRNCSKRERGRHERENNIDEQRKIFQ